MPDFDKYFKSLQSHNIDDITEHSHRAALKDLLESLAGTKIKILHEPKREGKFGSPDFKVTHTESIIGYVENKKIEENLDKTIKSEQIKKYQSLSDNILLTNYIDWVWIKEGKIQKRETLCFLTDIENKRAKLDITKADAVEKLIRSFLSQAPKEIGDAKKLAEALAARAKLLKDFLLDELIRQEKDHTEGRLYQLYETFKSFIFHELTVDEFADAFAQNLVYGLFLAKLNADTQIVNLYNAKKFIPVSFELIRELVNFLDELDNDEYRETRWIVEEVLTIMNNLDLAAIQDSLSFTKKRKDKDGFTIKDPYVYFYEDFLAAYDKNLRKAKGVYYTPPPVVNFIVRAIDDILINTFQIKDGLADRHKVTVLDFATGTGTFLVEVLQQIFDKLPKDSGKKDLIIKEHVLKNLFGFEYLIAPYTIAHLKLSQYLKDNGYELKAKERLQVYLTNTLEPLASQIKIPLLPALTEESKQAQKIKDQPILVITGNPPYSGESKNKGTWILNELKDYFKIDGKPLGERNSKWLNDDYVKFIRFAQYKMDLAGHGVVGIITNHSFIDNPTFRGMRQSLMNTFDQIYILDLHGNSLKKEKTPDGSKDENVFDIQQGVCISLFIKREGLDKKIYHADYYGSRHTKYELCLTDTLQSINWKELQPNSPFYFLMPQNQGLRKDYETFFPVKEMFGVNSVGIVTARDEFTIHFEKGEVIKTVNQFLKMPDENAREHFKLGEDVRDWKIALAKKDLKDSNADEKNVVPIQYRPFDTRYTYYTGKSKGFHCMPRGNVMQHMLSQENIGLAVGRAGQNVDSSMGWNLVYVSNEIIDFNLFYRGGELYFPLYLFETIGDKIEKRINFTKIFQEYINVLYKNVYIPERVMGYIYAILYSPNYRIKYAEFLKNDFPSIPFTNDKNVFNQLALLGNELIDAHLLKKDDFNNSFGDFLGKGDNIVEKPNFVSEKNAGKLYINKTQYFDHVPQEVYDFYIGGYQVLDKYLKDRKGKELITDEVENTEQTIKALAFTIEQMKKIDDLTKNWI